MTPELSSATYMGVLRYCIATFGHNSDEVALVDGLYPQVFMSIVSYAEDCLDSI